MSVSINHW